MGEGVKTVIEPVRVLRQDITSTISKASFVVVGGAGMTGESATRYFRARGLDVFVVADTLPTDNSIGVLLIEDLKEQLKQLSGSGFSIFSPGISPSGNLAQEIFKLGLPSISELDLLCHLSGEPQIAVTGTNGKSTTTTLCHEMLVSSGLEAELIGNIGVPFIEALNRAQSQDRKFVSEISSYQLEWSERVAPKVGIFLNLAPNHLERHVTMDEYFKAKLKLIATLNETSYAVISSDDPLFDSVEKVTNGKILWFGFQKRGKEFSVLSPDGLKLAIKIEIVPNKFEHYEFDLSPTPLLGLHNKLNLAASIPAALIAGATVEGINKVISNFGGLEHRLEAVPNKKEIRIINDSKATTATATATDLKGLVDSTVEEPITLLVGGLKKIGSWSVLYDQVAASDRVRRILFFGKDGREIMEELSEVNCLVEYHGSLAETLAVAMSSCSKNEIILFAPGCPSFDAYSGFEERGRHFKSLVKELAQ